MAYAVSTFGSGNSHNGFASRQKKSRGIISPGTLLTGVAVVAFAWVAATLITTQSMVLSLPGATMPTDNVLTPGATAFIVPQKFDIHAARSAAQARRRGLPAAGHADAVPADAPVHGIHYTPTRDNITPSPDAAATPTVLMPQLASALTRQAADLAQARASSTFPASTVGKSGRVTAEGSPAAVAHLRRVIALRFASATQSLLLGRYAASSMPRGTSAAEISAPLEIAVAVPDDRRPTPGAAAPLPAKDSDLPALDNQPIAENIPTVVPLARPEHIAARAPLAVADDVDKNDDSDDSSAPPSNVLAYAKPEDNKPKRSFFNPFASFSDNNRGGTAIYDISASTVYLPSGERLEAHSGLGYMQDNPRYVNRKNRGPTPPHTYNLTLRESLFHGVQALRLTPADGASVYGRNGLLAHTYMLGPRGASNGCVSFRDYRRFLAAYRRGEIKRLVVVAHLAGSPDNNVASR